MYRRIQTLLVFLISVTAFSQPQKFSYKTYSNIANYFESENDLLTFFNFHKGDAVAEIGAYNGKNIAGLSILTDSINFYAQDIDSSHLSQKNFDKAIKQSKKYAKSQTNTFHHCIGTVTQTNLPDNAFDKILLVATIHEFTFMKEMMNDIYKKLKPNGRLYILEAHCFAPAHKNYTAEELIELLKQYNFTLEKKDGKDLNNSSGLFRLILKKTGS